MCRSASERCELCIEHEGSHFKQFFKVQQVTVAERSKTCTVFTRSEAGIVGSNLTQGTDV
jgi:hypothetical protein